MDTVITVLDNSKLLKPQTLDNDNKITPYFATKETDEKGKCKISKEPEDWIYKMNGFENKEAYFDSLKRTRIVHNPDYVITDIVDTTGSETE